MNGAALGRAWTRLLDAFGILAGLAFVVMALLVTINVGGRNLGYGNIRWLLETTEYALYITTFLAAPWVLHLGAHVRVDLLLHALPAPLGRSLELLADLCGLLVSLVFARHGLLVAADAWRLNAITVKELAVPEWILVAVIPLASLLLAIEFVARLLRARQGAGRPVPGDP